VCTTRKSYEDNGVQLFNNKVLRSRSLRERPTKFPMSIVLCIGVRGGVRGGNPPPWLGLKIFRANSVFRASTSCSKIQNGTKYFRTVKNSRTHFVFQSKRKFLKILSDKKYTFNTVNSGHTLFFRVRASCSKILNVKSIFNTVKNFRATASCSKILNSEKIFNTAYTHLRVIRIIWASVLCNLDQSREWL